MENIGPLVKLDATVSDTRSSGGEPSVADQAVLFNSFIIGQTHFPVQYGTCCRVAPGKGQASRRRRPQWTAGNKSAIRSLEDVGNMKCVCTSGGSN